MKNSRIFYLEIFPFLFVKFSIYLNRRVFVMSPFEITRVDCILILMRLLEYAFTHTRKAWITALLSSITINKTNDNLCKTKRGLHILNVI